MRASVYKTLTEDHDVLDALDGQPNIFPNYSMDTVPVDDQPFVVLRFGTQETVKGIARGPRSLQVWAHMPRAKSNDFGDVDRILLACDNALTAMIHTPGADGYTVTSCRKTGEGGDYYDEGYKTIARQNEYMVLSRPSQ